MRFSFTICLKWHSFSSDKMFKVPRTGSKQRDPPSPPQNIYGVESHLDWHPSSNAVVRQLWVCLLPWCSDHFLNPLTTILDVFVLDCQTIFCFQHVWQKNLATLSVQSLLHIQKWVDEWPQIPSGAGINRLPLLFVLAFNCCAWTPMVLIQDSNIRRKFLFQVFVNIVLFEVLERVFSNPW